MISLLSLADTPLISLFIFSQKSCLTLQSLIPLLQISLKSTPTGCHQAFKTWRTPLSSTLSVQWSILNSHLTGNFSSFVIVHHSIFFDTLSSLEFQGTLGSCFPPTSLYGPCQSPLHFFFHSQTYQHWSTPGFNPSSSSLLFVLSLVISNGFHPGFKYYSHGKSLSNSSHSTDFSPECLFIYQSP